MSKNHKKTTGNNKILSLDDAAQYVVERLPPSVTWTNPKRAFVGNLDRGNVRAIGKRKPNNKPRFRKAELDRFVEWLANRDLPRGGNRADLSAIEGRLGEVSDRTLADEAGVAVDTVMRHRKRKGIPASTPVDLSPIRDRLGKEPDGTLAAEMGVSRKTVGRYRNNQGIKPYKRNKRSKNKENNHAKTNSPRG